MVLFTLELFSASLPDQTCLCVFSSRRIWRDTWASRASPTKCTESRWSGALSSLWWLWVRKRRSTSQPTKLHSTCSVVMDSVVMTTWEASCLVLNVCQFETTFLTFGLNAVWITTQEAGVEWQWFHILFISGKKCKDFAVKSTLNGWHFRKLSFEMGSLTIKQAIPGLFALALRASCGFGRRRPLHLWLWPDDSWLCVLELFSRGKGIICGLYSCKNSVFFIP